MGTWGTAIKSNDTSSDIYADFFELYNEGQEPAAIAKKLIENNKELFNNPDGHNNFWFVLALAQWETKSLEQEIFQKVKSIIESGQDLEVWRELDADESEIKKRKIALDKFLEKISLERPKAKARKKKSIKNSIFEKGICLTFKLPNGNYGGAVVLEADKRTGFGYNLIVTTRINQADKPTIKDFENAKVLVATFGNWENQPKVTWYLPERYKKEYSELFETIGKIQVDKNYTPNGSEIRASFSGGWQHIIEPLTAQFEYEKVHGETKSFPITDLTKKKKWWKL
ncbi:hypothetical protein SAMN00777080_3948 [Aquiflexum balticum DSM 16537]|uniref:DUF4259 domain-containing protein n=1 Tax=Aquiflexum balticum DSM 16537 TaxID=758820 RepID=A0A1W2H8V3_9BACT|nr:hypothetical protein [Aquiflexum balticum]SMD45300.1 hypothetical protein SAMN00777080_3948 [Aquiflexum balticum DSM 16537]